MKKNNKNKMNEEVLLIKMAMDMNKIHNNSFLKYAVYRVNT